MASNNFSITLFDHGNFYDCLYSYFCPCCALAAARFALDSSNEYVNCCCLSAPLGRYLIRTAYDIPGNPWKDCLLSCCCYFCVINQLYQSTKGQSNPIPGYGRPSNTGRFNYKSWPDFNWCNYCPFYLYSFCCTPCSWAYVLNTTIGYPYCLGLFCGNPFIARNVLRYQYRIEGHDFERECQVPFILFISFLPSYILVPFLQISLADFVAKLLIEIKLRSESSDNSPYGYMHSNVPRALVLAESYTTQEIPEINDEEGEKIIRYS